MPDNDRFIFLRNRASKNFEKYVDLLLNHNQVYQLPKSRLTDTEWDELNQLLAPRGIKMIDGRNAYMVFATVSKSRLDILKERASKHFDQYMNMILNGGERMGLPTHRLSPDEWNELNRLLVLHGVKLTSVQSGAYMAFEKIDKSRNLNQGTNEIKDRLFQKIKERYPNLSDKTVREIINENIGPDRIYDKIRYADKAYDTPHDAFIAAAQYGRQSNDNIDVFVYQGWTYSRRAKNRALRPANPADMYHISLNVHITKELLQRLDAIMAADAGRVIDYYKFPRESEYMDNVLWRHDPITIYTNCRDKNIEAQIAAAAAPFARSNEGLLGELLGRGVDINPETSMNSGLSVGQNAAQNIYMLKQKMLNNR